MKIRAFLDWITLADYEKAKRQSTKDIIRRYGRGNVLFQNGSIIDRADLARLSKAGDSAMARLKRLVPAR